VLFKRDDDTVRCLKSAQNLQSFGFFQRNSVSEFMKFTSKVLVEKSDLATRSSVKQQDYVCHVYIRGDRLAGIIISDQEYPHRVAHTLLMRVLDEFTESVPKTPYTNLDMYLTKFQNPKEADAMTKIQNDLDETKIILHNTITSVLQRGEKLDNLVAKSEDLSMQSKVFYKTARKTNQCCQLY
ncbi:palmitoyltransferase, partial [Tyrophagus putrescentiae]